MEPSSPLPESQQMEVDSLARVRNRLASSPDTVLAGIFTKLLPRLLPRFQSREPMIVAEAAGIFAHIEERLQLNPTDIVRSPWVLALLESLSEDESHTEQTFAFVLPTLERALSRCTKEDVPSAFPRLCRILYRLDTWLSNTTADEYGDPFRLVMARSLEATWARASWLIFDHILTAAGISPVLDWQKDLEDGICPRNGENNLFDGLELSSENQRRYRGTLFNLFLDAILFCPNDLTADLSRLARCRCEFRRRSTLSEVPPPPQNRFRQQAAARRRNPRTSVETWIPAECSYWKVLQHTMFQCARVALGASIELSAFYVVATGNLPPPSKQDESRPAASVLVQQMKQPKRKLVEYARTQTDCPKDLAVVLLAQLVGEVSFKATVHNERDSMIVGVHTTSNPDLKRKSLPRGAWKRCFQFLQDCNIDFTDSDQQLLKLFIALVSSLSQYSTTFFDDDLQMETYELIGQKVSPTQCFEMKILNKMKRQSSSLSHSAIDQASWRCACSILSSFRDDQVRRHRRELEADRQLRTADVLIHRNRERLAGHNLFVELAIQARNDAYLVVASYIPHDSLFDENGELSWDLALMALNCAIFDKVEVVGTRLQKACDAILRHYIQSRALKANRTQTLLLPIQRACSSRKTWVRQLVFDLSAGVIERHDPRFSQVVFRCMLHDEDERISRDSVNALTRISALADVQHRQNVQFISLDSHPNRVQNDLEDRIKRVLAKDSDLDHDSAFFMLKANWFCCEMALASLEQIRRDSEPSTFDQIHGTPEKQDEDSRVYCGVCFDVISKNAAEALSCQHLFCKECWGCAVDFVVSDGPIESLLDLTCLQRGCKERVTSRALQSFAPEWAKQWQMATITSFVNNCRSYSFCPNPDCSGVAVLSDNDPVTSALCFFCHTNFCPSCGEGAHSPVSCNVLREYQSESNRHDAAMDEIENRIQDCPNCQQRIQKNGGCNHMTCTACGHEFCWLCLSSDWASHTCRSNLNWELPQGEEKFRVAHQLVLHQEESEANEIRRLATLESNIPQFRARELLSDRDINILREASNELLRARKFLRFACTALYGLSNENTVVRFDRMRSDLQVFVERLNQLMDSVAMVGDEQGLKEHLQGFYFCKAAIAVYEQRLEKFLATL